MRKIRTALVVSSLVLAVLGCNTITSLVAPTPTAAVIVEPTFPPPPSDLPLTEADVPRVPLEAALAAYSAGAAVFVDVRSQQSYETSHVPGALYLPLSEFEVNITGLDLPKDQWIITYCTWPNEHTSARAAFLLLHNGYEQVGALQGGFDAWANAGYPVEP